MSLDLMWNLLIKGSIVIGVALAVSLLIHKSSAARRHVVWVAALAATLLLPFAELKLPSWSVSVEDVPVVGTLVLPRVLSLAPTAPAARPFVPPPTGPAIQSTSVAGEPFQLVSILPTVWLCGFLAILAWVGLGLFKARQLVRSSKPSEALGTDEREIVGRVPVLTSTSLGVAATAGVLKPVILLPAESSTWKPERLQMVLAHEMAHIQRRDWLWQILSQLACAVHFFNPLAWMAARQLRKESEFACDDNVLRMGYEPTAYAQELLDIARRARFQFASTVGMAKSKGVENRLKSIVDPRRKRNWVSGRALVGALVATLVIVAPVAILRAVPGSSKLTDTTQFKLPQIPWMPSQKVAPNVFLAKDGIAGLPDGMRVRLVGLTSDKGDETWNHAGGALKESEKWQQGGTYWQGNTFHKWSHGTPHLSAFSRQFIVSIQSKSDQEVGFTSQIEDPKPVTDLQKLNPSYAGGGDRLPDVELKANDPSYAIIELGIPVKADKAVYRVGIAAGKWRKIGEVANPYTTGPKGIGKESANNWDACGVSTGDHPVIYYQDANGGYHQESLTEEKLGKDVAQRIRVFDAEGQPVEITENKSWDTNGNAVMRFRADVFSRIARVELETCPYTWVEFRDVPLKPNLAAEKAKGLDSGIRGEATGIAPGFSKKLSNGVTVSLEAVTKATLDGSKWTFTGQPSWRGDGEVLKTGPKIYEFVRESKVWGEYPIVTFTLKYEGPVTDANTAVEPLGELNPKFWLNGSYQPSRPSLQSLTTSYLPSAKEGSLRVGVATGEWKTINTQKVDIEELPAVTGKPSMARPDQTGIHMTLGDIPEFGTIQAGKPSLIKLVDKPLLGVAKRFIAVMKNGDEKALTAYGHGFKGLEVYGLPARHGEFSENYNRILASEVKEIRLQTRPYEWVEFKGIALNHK
jgi:beta-lactamase regulating signal transducer with metallopeptidase domain